jgi:multidrug efflux pump subunit AcrA (membrane-fusion protein)
LNGRLGRRLLDPGSLVRADETALVTITSSDPAYVVFEVDERTALRLRRGQVAAPQAVAVGLADEEGFPHAAKVDFIDTKVDPKTGTLRMRAVLPNKDGLLMPGLSARVRLSSPRGGPPVGKPVEGSRVQALLKERLAVLKEILAETEKLHEQSGAIPVEDVLQARSAVLKAELELSEGGKDRVEIHERIVALARELENVTDLRFQAGRVPHTALLAAKANRLEAEVALEREKVGAAPRQR